MFDAATGKLLREPLRKDLSKAYPPLILAGRHLFVTTDSAVTTVWTADQECRRVATNTLAPGAGRRSQETHGSLSPIFEGTRLYFRTIGQLYCIGQRDSGKGSN